MFVKSAEVVSLRDATDLSALDDAFRRVTERVRRAVAGRPLAFAIGVRVRVVVASDRAAPALRPWHFGQPLPAGAVTLLCVGDATVDEGRV